MIRRAIGMAVLSLAVAGLVACGGGDSGPTAAAPVPAAPTKAAVTFNVDPNPVISEYQGDSWWRFKVNLEFYDTAGVGFQINSVRTTVSSTVTNTILLDYDYSIARHVNASGRDVLQFTSPLYRTFTGGGASVKFIANVTDDKGNSITLSNQATVNEVGAPQGELGR